MSVENNQTNEREWSNLVQGILFSLNLKQAELGKMVGVGDNSISRWLNNKRKPSDKHKLNLSSIIKENNLEFDDLIKLGKHVKSSLFLKDETFNKTKSIKRSEINEKLLTFNKDKVLLNTCLLFPNTIHGNEIKFIFDNNRIVVFFENKNKENPTPLILPRFIEVNDVFLIGLGIWIAEGTKTERSPKVTNSEPLIIQQSVKFFEHIGIDKSKLTSWIQVHERSLLKDNKEKLIGFWLQNTRLKRNQIKSIFIKRDRSTVNKFPVKEFGTLHLECGFILSRLLIEGLLLNVEEILKSTLNPELSVLKGVFCGEGWCGLDSKSRSVKQVTVTFKEKRWRSLTLNH